MECLKNSKTSYEKKRVQYISLVTFSYSLHVKRVFWIYCVKLNILLKLSHQFILLLSVATRKSELANVPCLCGLLDVSMGWHCSSNGSQPWLFIMTHRPHRRPRELEPLRVQAESLHFTQMTWVIAALVIHRLLL